MTERSATSHILKVVNPFWGQVGTRQMDFLIVFDDKDYMVGDEFVLERYAYDKPTGEKFTREIKYILRRFKGLQFGYIVLGFE